MKANTLKKVSMLALVVFGLGLGGCASLAPSGTGGNYGGDDRVVHVERDPVTGVETSRVEAQGDGVRSVKIRNNRNTRNSHKTSATAAAETGAADGRAKACAKDEFKDTTLCKGN